MWLLRQAEQDCYGLKLPGGDLLSALPNGAVEGNRTIVGGWEQFWLEPSTEALPALARFESGTDPAATSQDPSADAGLVAGLLAVTTKDRLRSIMPTVSAREDYAAIFPFLRTILSDGAERSEFDTRHYLRGGIAAFGWSVGEHTYGTPTVIDGQYGPLTIGRYCSIAGEVRLVLANHASDTPTTYPFAAMSDFWPSAVPGAPDHVGRGVIIGNSVWIGVGATILPGAVIGDGAIVGAQAVVAGNVPPYAVVVGNQARVIRRRFDEATVARFLSVRWWDWPDHKVDRFIPALLGHDVGAFLAAAEAT